MVPVARSVPKRPRHLLLSANTRSPSFWVGPIWFPHRDPGPTTRSRRRNRRRPILACQGFALVRGFSWTRRGSPEGLPHQLSWSRLELLLLAEEVLDVDRAVG